MSELSAENAPKKVSRTVRVLVVVTALLILLIALAPWIVGSTGLRDVLINRILASPSVTASSESASVGWFSPLELHGLQLNSANGRLSIQVSDISTERSPWQLWNSAPDLGKITVAKPLVKVNLPLDIEPVNVDRLRQLEPTFIAVVRDASLEVRV